MDIEFDAMDPEKLEKGAWDKLDEETEIRVRRANNPQFRKRLEELREEAVRKLGVDEEDRIPEEVSRDILAQAAAEYLLTDWRGMTSGGEEFPYSQEAALSLLRDRRHEVFLGQVLLKANDQELFRTKRREKLGNV